LRRLPFGFSLLFLIFLFTAFQNCARYSWKDSDEEKLNSEQIPLRIPKTILSEIKTNFPCVDGELNDVSIYNGIAYLAGRFNKVGHCRGGGVVFDGITAHSERLNAYINGGVTTAVPEQSGGWFIGGKFTKINKLPRVGLAHIFADGRLDESFDLRLNGNVTALYQNGDDLFISGSFTLVDGKLIPYLAIYNIKTKTVKDWHTKLGGPILTMAVTSSTLFVGGHFSKLNVDIQGGAALLNVSDDRGLFIKQFPLVAGSISASVSDGNGGWFLGGNFTAVGTKPCKNLAHILSDYSVDMNWQGEASGSVLSLQVVNGKLFVGGFFDSLNSKKRKLIGALDLSTGVLLNWDAQIKNGLYVSGIATHNENIFVGGDFQNVGDKPITALAAFKVADGSLLNWDAKLTHIDPNPSDMAPNLPYLLDMKLKNAKLFIAGQFDGIADSIGVKVRHNFAIIDLVDFKINNFDPSPYDAENASVTNIDLTDNQMILSGWFSSVKDAEFKVSRNSLAIFNLNDYSLKDLNLSESGRITEAVSIGTDIIYTKGSRLFRLNGVDGNSRSLISDIQNNDGFFNIAEINHLHLIDQNKLLLGGNFDSIGGQARANLAAIDLNTGSLIDWLINADNEVYTLTVSATQLYVGGIFKNINQTPQQYISAIDLSTKDVNPNWKISTNNVVESMQLVGPDQLVIGGRFNYVSDENGSQPRNYLGMIDLSEANYSKLKTWDAQIATRDYGRVKSLQIDKNFIYAGGIFDSVNATPQNNIAKLDLHTGALSNWFPKTTYSKYFSGGLDFISVNGLKVFAAINDGEIVDVLDRKNLAAYDLNSGNILPWDPKITGIDGVSKVNANKGGIFIGGNFTGVSTASISSFAAIDFQGNLSTKFKLKINGEVNALAYLNGYLFLGGNFTSIDSTNRNRIAALDVESGKLSAWNPNADAKVTAFFIDGESIYVGGAFSVIGNAIRSRVAKLSIKTGLADLKWDPFVGNGYVFAIQKYKNEILLGGDFKTVAGKKVNNLVAVDFSTGKLTSGWLPEPFGIVTKISSLDFIEKIYVSGICGDKYCHWGSAYEGKEKNLSDWAPEIGFYYSTLFIEPLEFEYFFVQGNIINLSDVH
jgi:hypothetical protein